MNIILLFVMSFFLCGCLLTHQDIRDRLNKSNYEIIKLDSLKDKDTDKTINNISFTEKFLQINTSFRELRGRIEIINKNQEKNRLQLEQALLAVIKTLDLRVQNLVKEIDILKYQKQSGRSLHNKKSETANLFYKAEKLFNQQQWKAAVVSYEEYRAKDKNKKFYKEATFKMGKCFKALEMHKESKVFFREVEELFPNSVEAKQAKKLLTQ